MKPFWDIHKQLKLWLTLSLYIWTLTLVAQNSTLDSLKTSLRNVSQDTQRVAILYQISKNYQKADSLQTIQYGLQAYELALKIKNNPWRIRTGLLLSKHYRVIINDLMKAANYSKEALELSQKIKDRPLEAEALLSWGDIYRVQRSFTLALDFYQQALKIHEDLDLKKEEALDLKKIGQTYQASEKLSDALRTFFKALNIQEQYADSIAKANTFNQIGDVYTKSRDYENALKYFQKATKIFTDQKHDLGLTASSLKIGLVYCQLMDLDQAQQYLNQVILLDQKNHVIDFEAEAFHNLALIAEKNKQFDKGLDLFHSALTIEQQQHNQNMVAETVLGIARIFLRENRLDSAFHYAEQSYLMNKKLENNSGLQDASYVLYEIFKAQHNYQKALMYHEEYKKHFEGMFNEANTRELARVEVKYELEQEKQKIEMEKTKELMTKEQEIQREKLIRNAVIFAFVFLFFMALILYRSYLIKRKDNLLLNEKNEEIKQQYQKISEQQEELLKTQDHLIKTEKLASLGQFMAGVAHEINSPMAAVQASGENIQEALEFSYEHLFTLFHHLSDEEKDRFQELVLATKVEPKVKNYADDRKLKKKYLAVLEELKVQNTDAISDYLVDLEIDQQLNQYHSLLVHPQALVIFQNAYSLKSQWQNSQNIKVATSKVTRILQALKAYTHTEINDSARLFDIRESIDSVLTLYPLSAQIELKKDYEDISKIACYPDELTQVWTNLIKNAIQAMKGKGILELKIRETDKNITIQVKDNGEGIPEELHSKVFEPFFTTKQRGEGSGIGLDISKKIIEKHQGEITFESEAGRGTTFTVKLPKVLD